MEKLGVYFKECLLGTLEFDGEKYEYLINEAGIKMAKKKKYPYFLYDANQSFVSEVLPESWMSLVVKNDNPNTMIQFEIEEDDIDYVRLAKVALADSHKPDFHFEVI
ncbi:MAG: hypothetical protein IKB06_04385 [Clostridia bacterium]|nr:hypothetical protein [Clostridia bacterium]